jgi:hypothetical protein
VFEPILAERDPPKKTRRRRIDRVLPWMRASSGLGLAASGTAFPKGLPRFVRLRAHFRRCYGGPPEQGAACGGEVGRGGRPLASGGSGLPERRAGGHLGRVGHPPVDRALQKTVRRPPENRDLPCEHQARLRARGDALATTLVGLATEIAAKMAAYTLRRVSGKPASGSYSRQEDQGVVGINPGTCVQCPGFFIL